MRGSSSARALLTPCRRSVVFPDPRARYASVGGKLNPSQPELIRAPAARMASDSEIVARWMRIRPAATLLRSCAARLNSPGAGI